MTTNEDVDVSILPDLKFVVTYVAAMFVLFLIKEYFGYFVVENFARDIINIIILALVPLVVGIIVVLIFKYLLIGICYAGRKLNSQITNILI